MVKIPLGFSKSEASAVGLILLGILAATLVNLQAATRRARDQQRKSDTRSISDALNKYNDEFGLYPFASEDGRILACGVAPADKSAEFEFLPCEWGKDAIRDISDLSYPAYLDRIPQEPFSSKGVSYRYLSNGKRFQLLAALESNREAEFDQQILNRQIGCGNKYCNFGLAPGKTPLNISLDEYERQLFEENRLKE